MNKYQESKIYKVISKHSKLPYYGSTVQTLRKRYHGHNTTFRRGKKHAVCELLKLGDCKIELVEHYPCNTKEELIKREDYYIKNNDCINIRQAYMTKEYEKEYNKKYLKQHYKDNKDKHNERGNKKITCECGIIYSHRNKARHYKTLKHKKYLETGEKQTKTNNKAVYEKKECSICKKQISKIFMNRHIKNVHK